MTHIIKPMIVAAILLASAFPSMAQGEPGIAFVDGKAVLCKEGTPGCIAAISICVRAPGGTDCGRYSDKQVKAWRSAHPDDAKAGDKYLEERGLPQ